MNKPLVGIVMGSDSDIPVMESCVKILEQFKVSFEIEIISAHRSPEKAAEYAKKAAERGLEVIIAGAGAAAALPGVLASMTVLPVIGVPLASTSLNGVDALYAINQMPAGVPVATMAIGPSGATNAGIFAVQILSVKYPELKAELKKYKISLAEKVAQKSAQIKKAR